MLYEVITTGEKFVNVWMHVGFVQIDQQKMSKSLGNFFTIREILARYRPEAVRFLLLTSHYRSPLNYSDRSLEEAKAALDTLYTALRGLDTAVPLPEMSTLRTSPETATFRITSYNVCYTKLLRIVVHR